jgi:membrane-associated phospholipid phosphatase
VLVFAASTSQAQVVGSVPPTETCGAKHLDLCLSDILHDQVGIWTSPFRLQPSDAAWLIPFLGATATSLNYDRKTMLEIGFDQHRINVSEDISRFGSPEATIVEGIGLYAIGSFTHHAKLAETGRLGTEAVVNAIIVTEAVKLATNRDRPDQGEKTGEFWPYGTNGYTPNSSFPSGHATAAWALASVVGYEYPSLVPRLLAYGFATAISVARVTGRDHFPSDVLVGGGIGFLTGGYVYHHHAAPGENGLLIQPLVDVRSRTAGVQASIPLSRFEHLFDKH